MDGQGHWADDLEPLPLADWWRQNWVFMTAYLVVACVAVVLVVVIALG
jgi:hypothetical protein